jgi:cold shock CspA family protein
MTLIPSRITFRGVAHDDALDDEIRGHISWLEQFYAGIVRCDVTVEVPHRHRQEGRHFRVRIDLTVPGRPPIIVSHEPTLHSRLKDAEEEALRKESEVESVRRYAGVAVRDAFDAARRRLEDAAREARGAVKAHEVPAHGEVVELSVVDGFGFIQAGEQRIYFNRASVLEDAFDSLTVGTAVTFVEEKGDKGPQASTVRVLGKHHYVTP